MLKTLQAAWETKGNAVFNWKIAYAPNHLCSERTITSIEDIEKSGFDTIDARVPGNFEIDLMNSGRLGDLYFSTNVLKAQEFENMHIWYYTKFDVCDTNSYLHFEGIDTVSEIFVNGRLVKKTDNMFIPYDVYADFLKGGNELVVHILPVCIEARKYRSAARCKAQKYNYASLYIRKAAHMFGWDIMPRIVSAGIWKPVTLEKIKKDKINEVYFGTTSVNTENRTARISVYINADVSEDFITDYSVKICGKCAESELKTTRKLWHNSFGFDITVENCKFWNPKNYGEPNLYEITVELYHKDTLCDTYGLNYGIRTVKLETSSTKSKDKTGDFCFIVNGKRVFVLGTNWVPLDALHSRDGSRLHKALEMLDDIGCNAVRCWGGNVYESDEFYDFCDKHGILVWQDFAMGCAIYPRDPLFAGKIEEEAIYQIKRLRNHASLALWAGDNECDMFSTLLGTGDPNNNTITRDLLARITLEHDYTREYLPSSPYIDKDAYMTGFPLPEDHLWGPRDYFKGEYYKNAKCRFVSETGYQGFPSPESMRKFLKDPEKIFENGTMNPTDEYKVHSSSPETEDGSPYTYRTALTYNQIRKLFTAAEGNFDDLIRQSQISQAEADKYFIERVRVKKGECTGIIWWNLLDGWPQVSDAVVDYYFTKKLAYGYIKRSQNPLCLMFDVSQNGEIALYAVNDLQNDAAVSYTVSEMNSGKVILNGKATVKADAAAVLEKIRTDGEEQSFYYIQWETDGRQYQNHYCPHLPGIRYDAYLSAMKKCGFDAFEGF